LLLRHQQSKGGAHSPDLTTRSARGRKLPVLLLGGSARQSLRHFPSRSVSAAQSSTRGAAAMTRPMTRFDATPGGRPCRAFRPNDARIEQVASTGGAGGRRSTRRGQRFDSG
jgi:hypothetical protein